LTTLYELTSLDRYLADQQSLTVVDRVSQRHDQGARGLHREPIPLERPSAGQQYAFEVDLDACTGCKSCVNACHSLNGLDEDESWRSVGLLYGGGTTTPWLQTVTAACHHCVEPACMHGCPVNAYEKDAVTGIVRHLDDQCIGCGYCTLTCPYEVPRFNQRRGIVRKCDLCSDRLDAGEQPACVQACPTRAIRVTVVEVAAAVEAAEAGAFLFAGGSPAPMPTAPSPRKTIPTTRYVTSREFPSDALATGHFSVRPAHTHLPLVFMLVLTQLSVGAFGVDLALRAAHAPSQGLSNAVTALVTGLLALGVSVAHLGRPLYAFRAVIGLRRSWLSREIVAFNAFALLAAGYAAALWAGAGSAALTVLGGVTAAAGIAGVTSSVMVYAVTGRAWWRAGATSARFGATALACGLASVLVTSLAGGAPATVNRALGALLALTCGAKLAWEASFLRAHSRSRPPGRPDDLGRAALLMTRDLHRVTFARFLAGGAGATLALMVAASGGSGALPTALAALALATVVAGELLERALFFSACTAPRMPGSL